MISRPAHMGTRAAGPGDVLPATASAFLFFPTCRAPSPCLSSPPWLSLSPCLFPTACRKPYPLYSPFSVFFDHRFNMCGLYILGKRRTHLNCGKHTYIYIYIIYRSNIYPICLIFNNVLKGKRQATKPGRQVRILCLYIVSDNNLSIAR